MNTIVTYGRSEDAWLGYEQFILELIERQNRKKICDIGGGANPLLQVDYISSVPIEYSLLDISETELNKASVEYAKINADISSPEMKIRDKFDLVFSKMLAEHIKDAAQFHKNIFNILEDGGFAIHFFPTLFSFPFLINHLIFEGIAYTLLNRFAPRDNYQHAKFSAHYSWCRGPLKRQIRKFENLGYEVVEYRGYFGHAGYYAKIIPLMKLHELKTKFLLRKPIPLLTSYAYVILRKPSKP